MSAIFLPRRWRHQPQGAVEVDLNHPLASGIRSALLLTGPTVRDPVSRQSFTGTGSTIPTRWGKARRFNGGQFLSLGAGSINGIDLFAGEGKQFSVVSRALARADGTIVARAVAGGGRTFQFYHQYGTVALQIRGKEVRGASGSVLGTWHTHTVSCNGNNFSIFGGRDRVISDTIGTAAENTGENIEIASRTGGTGFRLNGDVEYVYFFARALSTGEHLALEENPYQLFRAPSHRIWFDVGAGAPIGVEINAGVGEAVATGWQASIVDATAVEANTGAAVANGLAADVASGTTIAAGTASAIASGLSAGVVAATVIECATASALAAGASATVVDTTAISAQTGAAVAAGQRADVGAGDTISASTGAATASGLAAQVSSPLTIAAEPGAASAAGLTSAVVAGIGVNASTGQAAAEGLRADIGAGNTITAGVGAASARGLQASLSVGTNIAAETGAAKALGLAASVSAAQIVVAGVGAAQARGLRADVATGNVIEAGRGEASAQGLPAEVYSGVDISAGTATANASGLPAQISLLALHASRPTWYRGAQTATRGRPRQAITSSRPRQRG